MKRLFIIAMTIGVFITPTTVPRADNDDVYQGLSNFTRVLDLVERSYVDEVEPEKLTLSAIEGMLKSLDPYSVYLTPERYKEFEEGTSGEFGGVGLEITSKNDVLTIITPIEGTPAARAGIKPGDVIIKIEDTPAKELQIFEVVKLLRGPKGTDVTITIKRARDGVISKITLTRDTIHVRSVTYELKERGIGYVRLNNFQDKSAGEVSRAMVRLENENGKQLSGLILDLRNNPGGLLSQAVELADKFIDKGLIVSVKGRAPDQSIEYYATKNDESYNYPLVVLVNRGSASASEVVAEALQDRKRAVILGTETFGKGSVQTIIKLEDGSGLKLTTARFYAPSGRSINEVGVTPDVIVENPEDKDLQLKRAIELLSSGG